MDDLRFYILFNSISVISGGCLDDNERKSEISTERISVPNSTEKFAEPGIHCMPYSDINDIISVITATKSQY